MHQQTVAQIGRTDRRTLRLVKPEPTVADLAAEHLNHARRRVKAGRMAPSTLQTIEDRYRAAILPTLGTIPLRLLALGAELAPSEKRQPHGADLIERWHSEVSERAPVQANRAAQVLRAGWMLAERLEWVPPHSSPLRFLRSITNREKPRTRVLSENESDALLAELRRIEAETQLPSQRYAAQAVQLLALTGARRNEILSLTWPEVDLLHVDEHGEPAPRLVLRTHKTAHASEDGPKIVSLGVEAVAILERVERHGGTLRVFPRANWRTVFWPARKAIGAPDVTLHDLRRTFSSRLHAAGVPIEHIAAELGQRTVAVNARHYMNLPAETLRDIANRGAALMAGSHDEGEESELSDEEKAKREMRGINLELPADLLAEIAGATGEESVLKRSAVMQAIKNDLLEHLRTHWKGAVARRTLALHGLTAPVTQQPPITFGESSES